MTAADAPAAAFGRASRAGAGPDAPRAAAVVEARDVCRSFRGRAVLDGVSLSVAPGQVHALLGPNGVGKTTLLRILAGLTEPDRGTVRILGADVARARRAIRQRVGLVPSGDRSFYLRISGLENLVFFARLHGASRRHAVARAHELLASVGLERAARVAVGEYSHGMQKRLSVARALLSDPAVLLVDEATHDLDPSGAAVVRELVTRIAREGSGIVWATQRIDEIRGFVDRVSVLDEGRPVFAGGVAELLARAAPRRYLVTLANGNGEPSEAALGDALGRAGTTTPASGGGGNYVLDLPDGIILGDALGLLARAGIRVLSCTEERSGIEQAFLRLTGRPR